MDIDPKTEAKNIMRAYLQTEKEAEMIREKHQRIRKHMPEIHANPVKSSQKQLEDDFELAIKLLQEKQARKSVDFKPEVRPASKSNIQTPAKKSHQAPMPSQKIKQINELKDRRQKLERESDLLQQEFTQIKKTLVKSSQKENFQSRISDMDSRLQETNLNYLKFKCEKFEQKLRNLFQHKYHSYGKEFFAKIQSTSSEIKKKEILSERWMRQRYLSNLFDVWFRFVQESKEEKKNSNYVQERLRQVYEEEARKFQDFSQPQVQRIVVNISQQPSKIQIIQNNLNERERQAQQESEMIERISMQVKQKLEYDLSLHEIEARAVQARQEYLNFQGKALSTALKNFNRQKRKQYFQLFLQQLLQYEREEPSIDYNEFMEEQIIEKMQFWKLQQIFSKWQSLIQEQPRSQIYQSPTQNSRSELNYDQNESVQKSILREQSFISPSVEQSMEVANPWRQQPKRQQPQASENSSLRQSRSIPKPPAKLKEMEEKAQHRKKMYELIKKKHEEKRKQRELEKQLEEQEKQINEQRERQLQYEQYQLKKKQEKEAREAKIHEQQMAHYRETIAKQFLEISLLKRMWKTLTVNVVKAQEKEYHAEQLYFYTLSRKCFEQFKIFLDITNFEKQKAEQLREKIADQHNCIQTRRKIIQILNQNRILAQKENKDIVAVREVYLKRNCFFGWYQAISDLRQENLQIEAKNHEKVTQFRDTNLLQIHFIMWFQNSQEQRKERQKEELKNKMWGKVNDWLTEFDKKKFTQ